MMLRQYPIAWIGVAGIMLFIAGVLLDTAFGKQGTVHLILDMPVSKVRDVEHQQEPGAVKTLGFMAQLDSLEVLSFSPAYELQVREIDQEFSQQLHSNILPPSFLLAAFPLSPMKIRKVADTEFRFRLKHFYPDFGFQYNYPKNRDTISPQAPGITLNLSLKGKEEVITLRSDKTNTNRLEDVAGFGCAMEFYWALSPGKLSRFNPDSGKNENKIVFAGESNTMYWLFGEKTDSMAIALNHFYSIPGKDSLGFTVLQCYPDFNLLKAVPVSKSDKLVNPVAEAEVWKLGGKSQMVYLYPNNRHRHGGEWRVPGTSLLLSCGLSHDELVNACKCSLTLKDTISLNKRSQLLNGTQSISFGGKNLRLSECDPDGIWANLKVWTAPGYYLKITGLLFGIAGILAFLMLKRKNKRYPSTMI